MTDPLPHAATTGLAIRRRLVLAWLALTWERLWVRLWTVGMTLALCIIVLMTDVLPSLPWPVHALVVLAAAVGVGTQTWRNLRGFTWPTRGEARARLEAGSPVRHRPLTTVEDSLIPGAPPAQQHVWRLHQARAREALRRLRVKGPAPDIASRDRFAVRAAVMLALFVAIIGGWGDIDNRIWRGLLPGPESAKSHTVAKIWVTPPAYTGRSPIYLETPSPAGPRAAQSLEIPAGSKILAVVTGTSRDTALKFDKTNVPLEKLADETQRGEFALTPLTRLELHTGARLLGGWDVKWIPDLPPEIALANRPGEGPNAQLRIDYEAQDDYGVDTVTAHITNESAANSSAVEVPPLDVPLSTPASTDKIFSQTSLQDLTSHPWAGQKVLVQLTAVDQAGQSTPSAPIEARLPERAFLHPVAKELVQQRKGIINDPEAAAPPALMSVSQILEHPDSFDADPSVHLMLSTVKSRLAHETAREAAATVSDLMWHAALRIEDGDLAAAEERLASAEKALRDALERGASSEEIERLLKEMQQAVAEYARALAEKNPDHAAQDEQMHADDISATLEELRQMSEMGASEAAKQALQNLQNQLQALRNAARNKNDTAEAKQAQEMMQEMRELTNAQSGLLDESFDHLRKDAEQEQARHEREEMGNNSNPTSQRREDEKRAQADKASAMSALEKQEAVRRRLDELIEKMESMSGEPQKGLKEADRAMANASDNFSERAWKEASRHQGQALSKLQESMEQSQRKMMQKLTIGKGGRRNSLDTSEKVPLDPDTEGMAQRVRAILEDIRKRAADRTRPEEEQEYLRRLMKQF